MAAALFVFVCSAIARDASREPGAVCPDASLVLVQTLLVIACLALLEMHIASLGQCDQLPVLS